MTDKTKKSWRDAMPIHPAAEMFPRVSPDELEALAADIKKNGLKVPITYWSPGYPGDGMKDRPLYVLDGINRLDALEMAGIQAVTSGKMGPSVPTDTYGARSVRLYEKKEVQYLALSRGARGGKAIEPDTDPYAYVLSVNAHRRHLTAEKKRELIAAVLKAQPGKSNRTIAKQTKADDKTVGKVRQEMERRAEIPHVTTVKDTKGRSQPAKKPAKKKRRNADDFTRDMKAKKAAEAATQVDLEDLAPRNPIGMAWSAASADQRHTFIREHLGVVVAMVDEISAEDAAGDTGIPIFLRRAAAVTP